MKVAQLLATIPDALPPEYANELIKAAEPGAAHGLGFRQAAHECGARCRLAKKFSDFEHHPAAAASLGGKCIVHARSMAAILPASCRYPDMQSAVEADLSQLQLLFRDPQAFRPSHRHGEIAVEIGARVREELDYDREAKQVALYGNMLMLADAVRVPHVWASFRRAGC